MKQASLLFLLDNDRILLAMKKRGFGAGLWNGVGGKPISGESIRETAIRECQEEIMVTPTELKEMATLNFYFPESKTDWNQQVVVFVCTSWQGAPHETEEMAPKWFSLSEIPYETMWSDDKHWLAKVIGGEYVNADFYFNEKEELLKYKVKS